MLRLLAIALPAFVLDQLTKWAIAWRGSPWHLEFDRFHEHQYPVIDGFFYLVHWGNTGAAFSFMSGRNGFFVVLSVVATIAIFIMNRRGAFPTAISRWGAGLLLGGIFGNVLDRVVHGHVVDFLLFYLGLPHANPWPAFNVADSCICVAVGLFLIASFREEKRPVADGTGN
jgi:signal peptidase II